jgi:RNA polymerase sigma-70 factor (ECF subfamily)
MVIGANDREVIDGCQRGDQEAFRVLFETHKDKIYSIALRYSGDASTAMDIAQDTFLKLWGSIGSFRGEARFDTWLYRLVVNRCLDHHRRGRRLIPFVGELIDCMRAPAETALSGLLRAEMQEGVQRVVAELPPEQRMVVVLRYTEGMSYEQMAEILSCSMGTIASRLNRAHKALERRLAHLKGARGGRGA